LRLIAANSIVKNLFFMLEYKLRQPSPGQTKPPLTRLKELPAVKRAEVMAILRARTYDQARPAVEALVGFGCSTGALCRFFSWQAKQDEARASEDMVGQVTRFIREHRSDWTEDKVREVASTFFMMHAMKNRDSRDFVRVARLGLQGEHNQLDERKLDFNLEKLRHLQNAMTNDPPGLGGFGEAGMTNEE
jgi:hypothetical protein